MLSMTLMHWAVNLRTTCGEDSVVMPAEPPALSDPLPGGATARFITGSCCFLGRRPEEGQQKNQ